MRDLGWVEGRNLVIERRFGELDQAARLMSELRPLKLDVIVAEGPMVLRVSREPDLPPIVFSFSGDPVEAKLVASLPHPGGNLTGTTAMSWDLIGKRLDLAKQALPALARVAVLANPAHPGARSELKVSQEAARRIGVAVQYFEVRSADDLAPAFEAMSRGGAQAVIVFPDASMNRRAKAIAALASRYRIPAISGAASFVAAGNFMSYGPDLSALWRQTAVYADKILRGAKAADLPVEQPTRLELVINLSAARSLGVLVPQALLVQADRTID